MTDIPIKIQFVKSLSTAQPSRIVAVKADGDTNFSLWVTDKTGIPYPIKDNAGGGITAIQNTDGNLIITGTTTKTINVAPALLSLINSALQSGDNISELTNDANYITLADIPTFVASDYDLEDFTNTSLDPFIRQSDVVAGGANLAYTPSPTQGTVTSDSGSDATLPLADTTNAGLLSPAEKAELATALQPSDITNLVPYTGATTNVDLGEYQLKARQLELDQTPTGAFSTAKIRWNDAAGTAEIRLKGNNVTLQIGQELVKRVVNKTATNITLQEVNYQVVRIIGATGQRLSVDLAQADSEANSASTLGLVTENIANNQEGFITFSGEINLINTTGSLQGETWIDGDVLYLSPTIAGGLTKVVPTAPNHSIRVGYVQYAHATQGKIHVDVDRGYSLENLHNVKITATTAGKILGSTTEGLWENKSVAEILGYTPENVANKQNSLAIDGTGTKYPTVDAVNAEVVKLTGNQTVNGEKTFKNNMYFRNATNGLNLTVPIIPTNYSAENTVVGNLAGQSINPIQFNSPTYGIITGGTANTLYGVEAGYFLNAGNENTLIGNRAGYNLSLPIGNDPNFYSSLNTLIGSNAGFGITSGYANICIGQKAGQNISINSHNVIIGKSAGGDGTAGTILDGNIIIGSGAAKESSYSRSHTFIGPDAGHFSDGEYDIFLGTGAGDNTNINHTFIAGSDVGYIDNVYFGKGYKSAAPSTYTIHGTGGLGSEITGGNLVLAGGTGTGNANGGDVVIQTSDIISAGTQAHYLSDAVTIKSISQNVGIGNGSPSEKLEVTGNVKATSFIKTGGTSSEFLKADGSVTTLTNPITGTGTNGYMPKWTGPGAQGNSIVVDNGTNIRVNGDVRANGSIFTKGASSGLYGYDDTETAEIGYFLFNQYTGVTLSSSTGNPLKINTNGSETARFINSNLLLGTTTDTGEKLQVNGTIKATSYTGSATLTGAPTAAPGTNTTQIATMAALYATTTTELAYALSDETSNLTVGTLITFRMPFAMTLSEVRISLNDAPTLSSVVVDVKENGVSIFSTLLSIDANEKTSVTAATPAVMSDVNLADDAEITVSTTQIGSEDTGKGLKILFKGRKA